MFTVEKDWITESEFRAVLIKGQEPLSYICGYVGIPKEHPLFGISYNEQSEAISQEKVSSQTFGKKSLILVLTATVNADDEKSVRRSPDLLFDVHGGLTYSGGNKNKYPVDADLWWFGYDTNHYGDHNISFEYCVYECERLAKQLKEFTQT